MKRFWILIYLTTKLVSAATAQSFCASDGQPLPTMLIERFLSADCEACWRALPEHLGASRALALDWIVPSLLGDEAPLSAAASRDALMRLASLGLSAPATSFTTSRQGVTGRTPTLRVAHGVALGGYIGASIQLKRGTRHPPRDLNAWLVLVESIPAGTENNLTPINLVRNVLVSKWDKPVQLSKTKRYVFQETRPLSIPAGANPARLHVVGWVQDRQGRVLSAAQSVCSATQTLTE